jgi:hypothetical protein
LVGIILTITFSSFWLAIALALGMLACIPCFRYLQILAEENKDS